MADTNLPVQYGGPSKTPTLDAFGRDLTALARDNKLDQVEGRDEQIERVIQILGRRTKNNPCLIGEPGVGKTAIAEGLAQRIISGEVPSVLRNKRVITLDLAGLVAGTKYRGEFEERMKRVVDELRIAAHQIILFIDEVHTLVGAGAAEGAMDASNIIKPAMARGEMQCMGATTLREYRKYIERDSALERRFQPVLVPEPSIEQTVAILRRNIDRYEDRHCVQYDEEALKAAAELSHRYISDRFLPDKAIDLIDEAGARVRLDPASYAEEVSRIKKDLAILENQALRWSEGVLRENFRQRYIEPVCHSLRVVQENARRVTSNDIAEVVFMWTKIPVQALTESESQKYLNIPQELGKRVIGQEEAIRAIGRSLCRRRAGLGNRKRPIGSFLFLGPTGVGKTEVARALAAYLFGDEESMVRIDMSEYMEKFAVSRLVGAPPGYVGFDEGGQLTEPVRRKRYCVLLFDEIEKAHPDVFDLLLQILEDGRLTDSQGRTVNFNNTIIIMTSNAGSGGVDTGANIGFRKKLDLSEEQLRQVSLASSMAALKQLFRPEFINRLDEIIVFPHLSKVDVLKIVDLELSKVQRMLNDSAPSGQSAIKLQVSKEAKQLLCVKGWNRDFGARPLKRAIQRYVMDNLADAIIDGSLTEGTALIDVEDAVYTEGSTGQSSLIDGTFKVKKESEKGDRNLVPIG